MSNILIYLLLSLQFTVLGFLGANPEPSRPQEPKRPFPYQEEEVFFENAEAGITLAGTLTFPSTGSSFPAVVLIHGSSPLDRDETLFTHKPFLVWADYLTRHGIAVLRYDKRSVGKSTGNYASATSLDFADDAIAGVNYLKTRSEINPLQIGLIGHSEGGLIAPMAGLKSKDIAFMVLMAGPHVKFEEIIYEQGELLLKAAGADDQMIAKNRKVQEALFAILKQESDRAVAEKKLRETIAKYLAELSDAQKKLSTANFGQLESLVHFLNSDWMRFLLTYDPAETLRQTKVPVLALNGELDLQVSLKQNLPPIAKALAEGGNGDFTLIALPQINHVFQHCKTGAIAEYAQIEETIDPQVLDLMADWILKKTKTYRADSDKLLR